MTQAKPLGAPASAPGPAPPASFPWGAMAILFFAHFVVDSLVSMLSPLLPLLREKFQLTPPSWWTAGPASPGSSWGWGGAPLP
ncbi:MAG: hypothetical protein HYU38_03030 [Candidatus Tectomicrobia bacterium]|nr:hypothetical protein [Candidatus Tectomicrobia bacterium]